MISQFISTSDVRENYIIQDLLGEGAFAEVRKAVYRGDGSFFAIKIIDKSKIMAEGLRMYMNECQILLALQHPNIIEIYEIYDNKNFFYIVMEYCEGGELCDTNNLHRCLTEAQVADIVTTLTDALDFCHRRNIVHRDIKPQNILWTTNDETAVLKIADFGFAKTSGGDLMTTACGTPLFYSPQILMGLPYDKAIDYWSLGVITYMLLSGKPPFDSEDEEKVLFDKIKNVVIEFPQEQWRYITCSAKDFVLRLLQKNPKKRYNAINIRTHIWINSDHSDAMQLKDKIIYLNSLGYQMKTYRIRKLIEKKCQLAFMGNQNDQIQ